ncbi:unnamed protein product [Closterium sp. Yama58-4]|nr:unnamed protein product [Closterium sp. Yama58-4]
MFRTPVREGASREEVEASVAGFIGCGLDVGLLVSHALVDVLHNGELRCRAVHVCATRLSSSWGGQRGGGGECGGVQRVHAERCRAVQNGAPNHSPSSPQSLLSPPPSPLPPLSPHQTLTSSLSSSLTSQNQPPPSHSTAPNNSPPPLSPPLPPSPPPPSCPPPPFPSPSPLSPPDSDIFSLQLFDITEPSQPVPLDAPNDSSHQPPNHLFSSPNPAFPSLNYSVAEPFPEPIVGRHIQAYCSHLVPGSTWALLYAPLLLALLVLLVSALLSIIILVLRRKGAAIRAEMRAAEEYTLLLERAERAKSESIACLSHDLRTPFNGMLGMMDELLDTQLEEWQMRDVVDARTYAASVIGLLSTILDLAKLQADMLELDSVPFSLHQCLETAARSLFSDAQERHLECEYRAC